MWFIAGIFIAIAFIVGYFWLLWKWAEEFHRETNWWEYDDNDLPQNKS